jgi:superfamily II DNA helicase RecQ
MAYKFITVPVHDPRVAEAELNAFLRGHRVLAVERKWVESGMNSCWTFCVDYLESRGDEPTSGERSGGGRNRVDYREVLRPEEFAVFVRLRQWRKDVAKDEAVPVYTVFTNEQLAKMVQNRASARADLEAIAGVGDARIEKYGARVIDLLQEAWRPTGAADGKTV